jgi:hypothetical protein
MTIGSIQFEALQESWKQPGAATAFWLILMITS